VTELLEVEGLRVRLPARGAMAAAVDGVDFGLAQGRVLGIAGESGSGKTMTALALLGLLPHGAQVEGSARFAGADLLRMSQTELRWLRGRELAMVFQDPMTSLHPMLPIERLLTEHVRHHLGLGRAAARERALELLRQVRIPDPEAALRAYPHQFSGGMRQRIAIAIAIACGPKLLIADEPTTALDVTVQAGVLRLLDRLRREQQLAVIVITHDLGVLSAIADDLAVFYAGKVVEVGTREQVLRAPRHPYTAGLLGALPHPEAGGQAGLTPIAGSPPALGATPPGCAFHPRCPYAQEPCTRDVPPLEPRRDGRRLACPPDPLPSGTGAPAAGKAAPP
jgi:oligopeptide transport system ATP-binding protein